MTDAEKLAEIKADYARDPVGNEATEWLISRLEAAWAELEEVNSGYCNCEQCKELAKQKLADADRHNEQEMPGWQT